MTWGRAAIDDAHRLAVASCVGAGLGLLVGGVGGRLFMGLLAGLNREDHGVITSDGFPMGEFTVSGTLVLLTTGTVLGVLGAGIYVALRSLTLGPSWFRRACVVVGGTVMVGAFLVHEDGPDFTLLEPTWAAIALALSVPALFLLAMAPLVDRAVRDGAWLMRSRVAWAGLAPWVFPLFPFVPLFVAGWLLARVVPARAAGPWLARAALVVLFVAGAANLVAEIVAIYDTVGRGRYLLG
ncbi:hypothetical protein AFL01nite_20260 [Aeromicrobium flavum]|uniref:Uncharacterized protein n=1 Tax=Aeromicrobium flavum TaxID=416568 RepID=A0A512HW80_9ACTN|nr:hypothetical protein [Aeromicrobium flavum]GEO89699.1 hypothetical protein AFL01nite_20260 [Aeromicrobium flavum]